MSIRVFAPAIKHRVRRVGECTCGGVYTVDQVPIDLSTRFLDSYSMYCIGRSSSSVSAEKPMLASGRTWTFPRIDSHTHVELSNIIYINVFWMRYRCLPLSFFIAHARFLSYKFRNFGARLFSRWDIALKIVKIARGWGFAPISQLTTSAIRNNGCVHKNHRELRHGCRTLSLIADLVI